MDTQQSGTPFSFGAVLTKMQSDARKHGEFLGKWLAERHQPAPEAHTFQRLDESSLCATCGCTILNSCHHGSA